MALYAQLHACAEDAVRRGIASGEFTPTDVDDLATLVLPLSDDYGIRLNTARPDGHPRHRAQLRLAPCVRRARPAGGRADGGRRTTSLPEPEPEPGPLPDPTHTPIDAPFARMAQRRCAGGGERG